MTCGRAETFTSDQFSQVEVTSTQLTGGQWIGPAVRAQAGGQDGYVGFYYWNYGSPELMLFKRYGGRLGPARQPYNSGPLAAGTQLEVTAVGSTISLLENGIAGHLGHGQQHHRGRAGHHGLRQRRGRQLVRRGRRELTRSAGLFRGFPGRWCLQDNGGDNLSVSSNGSFTFATALAGGAGYDGDGGDQSVRPDLHGVRGLGHGSRGQRDQCRGLLHEQFHRAITRSAGLFPGFPGRWCLQDNGGDNLSVSSNGSFRFRYCAGRRGGLCGDGGD